MRRYNGWQALTGILLLFWISWAASGCSGNKQYQSEAKDFSSTFLIPMDKQHFHEKGNVLPSQQGQDRALSVQQASILAAQNDEKVLAILSELKKAKIDVKDALTHIWPRFDLHTQADIPVKADNDQKTEFTGGAYVKYDVWKAVAVDDEHALRQALVNKELEQLKIVLNGLLEKILHQLAQISFLDYKIQKRGDSITKAKNAYEIAKAYAQHSEADEALVQTWRSRIDSLTLDLKKSEQELRSIKHSFAYMIGRGNTADVDITDMKTVLSSYGSLPENVPSPSEIWSRHSEARLAEVEYVAAAVSVKLMQMESWPRLQTSLGLGKVPLTDRNDTAATLLQVSINLPLWDLGDNERKVAKAEITRNLAKSRLQKKALDLYNRAQEASFIFHAAQENYRDLSTSSADMNKRLQNGSILLAQNRLNPLEGTLAQLNVIEADIMCRDAQARIQEAGGKFQFSLGEDVIKDTIPVLLDNLLREYAMDDQPSVLIQNDKKPMADSPGK
jgi:outer membrane protein TolC